MLDEKAYNEAVKKGKESRLKQVQADGGFDDPESMELFEEFKDYKNKRILVIDCSPGLSPAYVKNGNLEKLYIRTGAATNEIPSSKIHEYINNHFEKK